jgi:ribonuclease BN (tRNA processing enzyme)
MEIRILGAHNTETKTSRMSGVLVDGIIALDAGALTSSLSMDEQLKLEAVLLTHQHYDHIRDVPILGMNLRISGKSVNLYALPETLTLLKDSIINGVLYSRFYEWPEDNPALRFVPILPGEEFHLGSYRVLPVSMPHSVPAVGYLIKNQKNKSVFYTGDTGLGFATGVAPLAPDTLIVEVTSSNHFGGPDWAKKHLCPDFLKRELVEFKQIAGYLPRVICVHMYEPLEEEIKTELSEVAEKLGAEIIPAVEGLRFEC